MSRKSMKRQTLRDWRVAIVAILCIAAMEIVFAIQNVDGALAGLGLAAIAGIAGWATPLRKG